MKKLKKYFILSNVSAVTGAVSLLSILILQKIQNENIYQIVSVVIGLIFWLSILITVFSVCRMSSCRKSAEKERESLKMHIGVISFMKTPAGKIADSVLIVLVIIFIILLCKNVTISIAVLPVLSVLYLSFQMHCLYNGKNYCFLKGDMKDSKERKSNE